MHKQSGVSLAEVLIGLALASLIMTLLMQFYLSSKRQYLEAEEILSRSLDLRWVGDLLSDSIRRAGFTPCVGIEQLKVNDRRPNSVVIRALNVKNEVPQSIQINRMNERFTQVIKIKNSTQIMVASTVSFKAKRPLMIADCEHAEVQQIVDVELSPGGTLITLARPLLFSYAAHASVGGFLEERWLIKKNFLGEETLHYQLTQTEEITPLVHSLNIHQQNVRGRALLEVNLGLAEGKSHKLLVAVRGL